MGEAGTDTEASGAACLNCGHALTGPYCSACGQKARVHRSLRAFFGDFASGAFNFEGKIWRTIPMLAWKPGELTRRYIEGERARFVSPVALYLFTVFLMFAVLSFTGAIGNDVLDFSVAAKEQRDGIEKLKAKRADDVRHGRNVVALDRKITAETAELAQLEQVQRGGVIKTDKGDREMPAWLRGPLSRVQRDPKGAIADIQDATSKFSWLLIPLSVPFLWLLFPFSRRYRMYDHGVFVTYSLSFMMILVVAGGLLVWAGMPSAGGILAFIPPFHMYRQLKGAYRLGWFSALLRTIALVSFAFVAAILFAMVMVAIGIM